MLLSLQINRKFCSLVPLKVYIREVPVSDLGQDKAVWLSSVLFLSPASKVVGVSK